MPDSIYSGFISILFMKILTLKDCLHIYRAEATAPHTPHLGGGQRHQGAQKWLFRCPAYIPNIFQHIKSDRDLVNPLNTAGINKIEYADENNKKSYYIGVTK